MNAIKCFAWQDNDPKFGIYLYSISETEKGVRTKLLMQSMGRRYDYGGHDEEWERLLTFGQIVPVVVSLTPPATPKEKTDAMISELREAGGSDLDNAVEASEATDGTAVGWTIIQGNSDGSILCRNSRGTRRRFWFGNLQSSTTGNAGEE